MSARTTPARLGLAAVAALLFASLTVAVSAYSPARLWLVTNADGLDHVVRVESDGIARTLIVRAGTTTKLVADNATGAVLVIAFRDPCRRSGTVSASVARAHVTIEPGGQLTLRDVRHLAAPVTPAQAVDECSGS